MFQHYIAQSWTDSSDSGLPGQHFLPCESHRSGQEDVRYFQRHGHGDQDWLHHYSLCHGRAGVLCRLLGKLGKICILSLSLTVCVCVCVCVLCDHSRQCGQYMQHRVSLCVCSHIHFQGCDLPCSRADESNCHQLLSPYVYCL